MNHSQLTLRMPEALDARLEDLARRMRLSKADLVRHALDQMLPKIEADGIVIRPAAAVAGGGEGRAA